MTQKKITGLIFILMLITGVVILLYRKPSSPELYTETSISSGETAPVQNVLLSQDEIDAMNIVIQDEYKAEQTYEKIVEKFGDIRPFSNIINAEVRHSTALAQLFVKYGLDIPDAQQIIFEVPDSIQTACSEGVAAEKANIALYEKLLPSLSQPDVLQVFQNNMAASQDKHLPAFSRCAQ